MIRFTKPFVRVDDIGHDYWPYIIAYRKIPKQTEWKEYPDGMGEPVVVSWSHKVVVNLWIVIFDFTWITKVNN